MSVITTRVADCRDCHRCLRRCPVKAISFKSGQAQIIDARCIACGRCTLACPQDAKVINSDLQRVQAFLAEEERVVLSVAPSFAAAFSPVVVNSFVQRVKSLGFTHVEETAVGAEVVAHTYKQLLAERKEPLISSCCPAVVNLVEKHYPQLIPYLSPCLSPMATHAYLLKERYGPAIKVVFVGPCTAKIDEARRPEVANLVDGVITFAELAQWFAQAKVEEGDGDAAGHWASRLPARAFPVEGGVLQAAGIARDMASGVLSISGFEECFETFEDLARGKIKPRFIEAMICSGGCVGGPAMPQEASAAANRLKVAAYYSRANDGGDPWPIPREILTNPQLTRSYQDRQQRLLEPSPEEIAAILARTGKTHPADEANCGGCGYNSCREKARAVYQGWAEEEMCIPFMKSKLSSLAAAIVSSTASAVVVTDANFIVQEFSPHAAELFSLKSREALGRPLHKIFDPTDFVTSWMEQKSIVSKRVEYPQWDLVTLQTILPIKDYGLVVGIINDISKQVKAEEEAAKIRYETLVRAEQVIDRQMKVAQEIASLLGETTAETKAILWQLIELARRKEEDGDAVSGGSSPWQPPQGG